MSRTNAHRPRWVWMNHRPDLVREHHNHAGGPCTLPTAPFTEANVFGSGQTCWVYLDWNVRTCSCNLCTGHQYHRTALRASRAATRTLLLAAKGGAPQTRLELLESHVRHIEYSRW